MHAHVRRIEANDIPGWPNWAPKGAVQERQWFTVSIGPEGSEGTDLFQVAVATSRGLKARRRKAKFVGLIVGDFAPAQIEQAIRDHVASVRATTWEGIVHGLSPVMRWEYADYK